MSKNEILQELCRLTAEEREEIRAKLNELDGPFDDELDDELTPEQDALVDERIKDLEQNPGTSIPWATVEARLKAKYGE